MSFKVALTLYLLLISALAYISVASGLSSRSSYAIKETHQVSHNWLRGERAPEDHRIEFHIGLRHSRFDELEQHLFDGNCIDVRYYLVANYSQFLPRPALAMGNI